MLIQEPKKKQDNYYIDFIFYRNYITNIILFLRIRLSPYAQCLYIHHTVMRLRGFFSGDFLEVCFSLLLLNHKIYVLLSSLNPRFRLRSIGQAKIFY